MIEKFYHPIETITIEHRKEIMPFKSNAKTRRDLFKAVYIKIIKDCKACVQYTPLELRKLFEEILAKDTEIKKLEVKGGKRI